MTVKILSLKLLLILSLVFLAFSVAVFFDSTTNAVAPFERPEDDDDDEEEEEPPCQEEWVTYYRCTASSCGGELQMRECEENCGGGCESPTTIQKAGEAQLCAGGTSWDENRSSFNIQCSASGCYPAPVAENITSATLYPQNVFDEQDKVKLPVNIGWSDVNEWAEANSIPQGSCTVESYNYQIFETGGTVVDNQLISPSTEPVLQTVMGECQLAPGKDYNWQTKACSTQDNTDCSGWSTLSGFSASPAPELFSPYDPDFEGPKTGASPLPVTLKWCEGTHDTKSYFQEIYEEGELILSQSFSGRSKTEYPDGDVWKEIDKGLNYSWRTAACSDDRAKNCSIFSQLWSVIPLLASLETSVLQEPFYDTGLPKSILVVNFSQKLLWTGDAFAPFYLVRLASSLGPKNFFTRDENWLPLANIWGSLDYDTVYTWKVKSCYGNKESECEQDWSDVWKFKTTGAPPIFINAGPIEGGRVGIPLTLSWNDMPGALSYFYQVARDQDFNDVVAQGNTDQTEIEINYENEVGGIKKQLEQDSAYFWQVSSCADIRATKCGDPSTSSFTTVKLEPPQITSPEAYSMEFTPKTVLSWNKVFSGNYYQYSLDYTFRDKDEKSFYCWALESENLLAVPQTITTGDRESREIRCMGNYKFDLEACIDKECQVSSPLSSISFSVKEPAGGYGLIPCDAAKNNPTTKGVDEREPCQLKHLFLLLKNLIDFLLWRLVPIIIAVFAVVTGALMYFSFGDARTLAQIKAIWKAVLLGALILFFSWLLVNLILGIAGFDINVFGRWHEFELTK